MLDEDRKGETNWKSKKGASALVLSQLSVTSLCIFPSRKELGWWGEWCGSGRVEARRKVAATFSGQL